MAPGATGRIREEGTRLESLQDPGPWSKKSLQRNERMGSVSTKDSRRRMERVLKANRRRGGWWEY